MGLGKDTPFLTGSNSDSLIALNPQTKKWTYFKVPYPLGFYSRGMDARIDDANLGWKGRALYSNYGTHFVWHIEGGKGTKGKSVKFQLRPDPLAKVGEASNCIFVVSGVRESFCATASRPGAACTTRRAGVGLCGDCQHAAGSGRRAFRGSGERGFRFARTFVRAVSRASSADGVRREFEVRAGVRRSADARAWLSSGWRGELLGDRRRRSYRDEAGFAGEQGSAHDRYQRPGGRLG